VRHVSTYIPDWLALANVGKNLQRRRKLVF
jgi:hypothetical protein